MSHETLTVDAESKGQRIDSYLADQIPAISRSKAKWLIEAGHVQGDAGPVQSPSLKCKEGMVFTVELPEAEPVDLKAVPMDLDIVFEDAHMLVINKPAGLTVHPAPGHQEDTLVNALLAHCGDQLSAIGDVARPGIVHRLDKDTSGLMVVAKTDRAHRYLAAQLADRSLSRTYHALVWGVPVPPFGTVDAPIARSPRNRKKMAVVEGGRDAVTHYRLIGNYAEGRIGRVECRLETGRTHQIRVHMAHIDHPLVGDPVYGGSRKNWIRALSEEAQDAIKALNRQALHAVKIGFIHPESEEEMTFECAIPADLQRVIQLVK